MFCAERSIETRAILLTFAVIASVASAVATCAGVLADPASAGFLHRRSTETRLDRERHLGVRPSH